ncbi:MAG: DUF359 domain-containing protein [Euryarchaeota archaeon]|nr:DUF359 domain-containing protein [Euryarchaeota archaeon]
MRDELTKPLGRVYTTEEAVEAVKKTAWLVAVGDVTTESFLEGGLVPRVMVVDFKTRRSGDMERLRARLAGLQATTVKVQNPAARITDELWQAVASSLSGNGHTVIEVDGEEDLAALPALMLAPNGTVIAYGQPEMGVVLITVDAAVRARVRSILQRMEVE